MPSPLLRIVVADDEPLARERLRSFLRGEAGFRLVGEAGSGPEAVSLIREHRPHVALLDIRLPDMTGFDVLHELHDQTPPVVIFVTASGDHAIRAFEAQAVDYLLKPFTRARFSEALERARRQCRRVLAPDLSLSGAFPRTSTHMALRTATTRLVLAVADIQCVTSAADSCEVSTSDRTLVVSETLGSLELRLPRTQFLRVSRFALVNLSHVVALQPKSHGDQHLLLRCGRQLTVSRAKRPELLRRLNNGYCA